MSGTKDYSPLRTLEEEEVEDDLELGPVRKVRYKKPGGKNRYHDLFMQYDLESSIGHDRPFRGRIFGKEGSRKGLFVGIAMGIVLITLIITAVVYVSSGPTSQDEIGALIGVLNGGHVKMPGVSLEDVLSGKFYSRGFNGTWISDTELTYTNDQGDLLIYDVMSETTSTILSGLDISQQLEGKSVIKCTISPDRNFVLLAYDAQKIFRHSTVAKYGVFDLRTRQLHHLAPSALQHPKKQELLQFAEWGPVNNSLVFIHMNDVFYKESALDKASHQLTDDGSQVVYNGVTDWVYEEEVFGSDSAIWFSGDGSHLAFVTFNDTLVDEIHFELYGEPGPNAYQYPVVESVAYPKAGRPNPTAEVTMVKLPGQKTAISTPLKKGLEFHEIVPHEYYVYGVVWASASEVLVVTLNRHQNVSTHHLCTITDDECEVVLVNEQQKGWIDVEIPKVSSDGTKFLTLTSQLQEDGKWYRHILKYSKDSVSKVITRGDFAVDAIVKWDEVNHRIYFIAPHYHASNHKAHPSSTHLYYVNDAGTNASAIKCLTCHSVNSHKETCDANEAVISKKASYFVHTCAGPGVPEVFIKSLTKDPVDNALWMDNADLHQRIKQRSLPIIKNFEIPIANDLTIQARLHIPPTLDPKKKYPMLVDVYGGPGSQKITDKFQVDWSDTLVTSKEIIYAHIDGRGSGRQSDDLKFQIYRRLGTVEIEDQRYATGWLQDHVPFIDANRTGIWGWSYGGFASAMALATDTKGIFKCGISVAPVTNWKFYDTIYTERYMGLPTSSDNAGAYNRSDITNHIENFRHKKYFLVHGTADDNVHYQQSMILSRALEKADILFRQMSYPDENHALGSIRKHLYHSLEDFLFTQCF